jgi:predicted permease
VSKDFRFALRFLARRPGFSAVVIISLALAIGANTAIFSLVNAVLLGAVPIHEPDRVVAVYTTDERNPGFLPVSDLNGRDLAEQSGDILDVTRFSFTQAEVADGDTVFGMGGSIVSANYFDVLGVEPVIGRTFEHDDTALGGHPEVVLGYGVWQERFGGDPNVIGRTLRFNDATLTVVGVAPEAFGKVGMFQSGFFVPYSVHREIAPASQFFGERRFLAFGVFARMHDGVTNEQANAELERIGHNLAETYPMENEGRTFVALPIAHAIVGPDQRDVLVTASALMLTIVGFVLLIACANAANLMLARAASRRSEMAIRQVLGATSTRLLRQLLTESVVLAGIAGLLGLMIAIPLQGFLWDLRPEAFNLGGIEPTIDATVLMFTILVTLGTGVLFGLVPALRSTRVDLVTPLKEETTPVTGGGARFGLRTILVVVQVALSMVALVGAGLFIRSMENARSVDPGFRTQGLVMANVNLRGAGPDPILLDARREELRLAVEALPEVEAAGFANREPLSAAGMMRTTFVEGSDAVAEDGVLFNVVGVTPGYFDAVGIALLEGRVIEDTDAFDRERVVVVNDAFARRFWPEGGATGHQLKFMGIDSPLMIVGVVETVKIITPTEDPLPMLYVPVMQWPEPMSVLHVHTSDPEGVGAAIEHVVATLGGDIRVDGFRRVETALDTALAPERTAAMLLGSFGVLALGLAFVGIYGVMSYTVRQRTREIGIRMALGAKPRDVMRWVLLQAMSAVVLGVGVGVAGGLLLQSWLSTLLFRVPTADVWAYGGAAFVLVAVALVAGWLPARHATRINPNAAIRHE